MSLKDLTSDDLMQKLSTNTSYKFSAVKLDELDETEYTLATIVVDVTGSVSPFASSLLEMVRNIVKACRKAPRSDNLLVRIVTFNTNIYEIHGFQLLRHIDEMTDYKSFNPYGATALYDAVHTSIDATLKYGEDLRDQDYGCNAIIAVITDGEDNSSNLSPGAIRDLLEDGIRKEKIESIISILIGVGRDTAGLKDFKDNAGLTQYIDAGDATPENLAKIGGFISESISSQSNALGSGSASQPLTF